MNYLVLLIIPLGLAAWYLLKKFRYDKLDKFGDMEVSVLLDHNVEDRFSYFGCFIFKLKSIDPHIKEIVITSVHPSCSDIRVHHFMKLNFFISLGESVENVMRSISMSVSRRYMHGYKQQKLALVLKGYIRDEHHKKHYYMKAIYFKLPDVQRNKHREVYQMQNSGSE